MTGELLIFLLYKEITLHNKTSLIKYTEVRNVNYFKNTWNLICKVLTRSEPKKNNEMNENMVQNYATFIINRIKSINFIYNFDQFSYKLTV